MLQNQHRLNLPIFLSRAMTIKVFWFEKSRGRQQLPVLIGAYGGVPVEWVSVNSAEWPVELKPKTPFGQLPFAEDGSVRFAQSYAIARYIARKGKLEGSTDADFATSEQLYEESVDLFRLIINAIQQEKEEKERGAAIRKAIETETPKHLEALEKLIIENSGHFVSGSTLVAGEIAIFSNFNFLLEVKHDLLEGYPKLKKFYETTLGEPKFKSYFDTKYDSFLAKFLRQN